MQGWEGPDWMSMSTLGACVERKRPLNPVLAIPRLMPSTGQRDPPMVSAQGILPSTPRDACNPLKPETLFHKAGCTPTPIAA